MSSISTFMSNHLHTCHSDRRCSRCCPSYRARAHRMTPARGLRQHSLVTTAQAPAQCSPRGHDEDTVVLTAPGTVTDTCGKDGDGCQGQVTRRWRADRRATYTSTTTSPTS